MLFRSAMTETAKILQMERGEDKRISKRKRIEPRKYAILKEEEKAKLKEKNKEIKELKQELENELLSKQELKQEFEKFRKENANQGLKKEFFRELGGLAPASRCPWGQPNVPPAHQMLLRALPSSQI